MNDNMMLMLYVMLPVVTVLSMIAMVAAVEDIVRRRKEKKERNIINVGSYLFGLNGSRLVVDQIIVSEKRTIYVLKGNREDGSAGMEVVPAEKIGKVYYKTRHEAGTARRMMEHYKISA